MHLLIVRHAIAVPYGTPDVADDDRPLTEDGRKRFRRVARGMTRLVHRPDALLSSPHLRAWQTAELKEWGVEGLLEAIGVEIVSPYASNREVAECDLGVTGADFALPETGTLGLRASIEQPRTISLLPRVHLALLRTTCLRADLHQVFEEAGRDGYLVFITGPSRTADIELTVTIGVHGPKRLCVILIP